ncbi:MAG TPA: carbon-nitrogen family hydrolase [Acidobacteriota bacterium]
MRFGLIQLDIAWEDKPRNYARASELAAAAARQGCDCVVLPEMFATGFSMNEAATSEEPGGATTRFLCELARAHGLTVIGTLVERAGGAPRNSCLIVDPNGAILERYAKAHPFAYAQEDRHYPAGPGPIQVSIGGLSLAPFICYDLRFPELFRPVAAAGAEVLAVVANWPAARIEHWTALLKARAIECQAFALGVNRCGRGGGLDYPGGSIAIDPLGAVIWEGDDRETVGVVDLDPALVARVRRELPFLPDMRPALYSELYRRLADR